MMEQFFDWAILATYAGATAATAIVTQIFKDMIKIKTQVLSLIVAFVVLLLGTAFTSGLTVESALLCVINAVVVSLASNGAFEALNIQPKE